ncbi:hypothetical protein [Natranaeroarchaeum sulfidigenes]|uniref:Uncharacterized protein n=1 Tax=Natranaeroarchaeum sulfidigenes TaxID=2784880 RepID=A0A897N053_9EURY|nr:hypothetical protein [Natranaeroarchaeum sulfidigenes]QSG03736.1 Uncharacterized protein AArcS_2540 [Natranaeroarchaeum sulfidigenes]
MARRLLALVGVIELLVPGRVIEAAERIALENPDDTELRAWTIPMARLEALVWLLLARRGDPHGRVRKLFAFLCGPAALVPRRYVDVGARLVYTDPDRCEWKPWVVPATRVFGILCILLALSTRGETDGEE